MKRLTVVLVALAGATSCGYKQPIGEMCGNAGAASFSIPKSEIYIWESGAVSAPQAGSAVNVTGVVLMLRWPGMDSRSGNNYDEFYDTYMRSLGPTPWFSVLMNRPDKEHSSEVLSNLLKFNMENSMRNGGQMTYMHDVYGLRHAVYQSAPGQSYRDIWFYWGESNVDGAVDHYIICKNSVPDRPKDRLRLCVNTFHMSEINMRISINYRDDMLNEWLKIQQGVRKHLLSKIEECEIEVVV